jgi:hypothetical protein
MVEFLMKNERSGDSQNDGGKSASCSLKVGYSIMPEHENNFRSSGAQLPDDFRGERRDV